MLGDLLLDCLDILAIFALIEVLLAQIKILDLDESLGDFILTDPQHERNAVIKGKVELLGCLGIVNVKSFSEDVRIPKLTQDLHALSRQVLADLSHEDLGLGGPNLLLFLSSALQDGKDALDTDRYTYSRDILSGKHTHEAIIATTSSDGATVAASEHSLVNETSVVVKTSGQTKIEEDVVELSYSTEVSEELLHIFDRLGCNCVALESI